jgi:hypothetical protein
VSGKETEMEFNGQFGGVGDVDEVSLECRQPIRNQQGSPAGNHRPRPAKDDNLSRNTRPSPPCHHDRRSRRKIQASEGSIRLEPHRRLHYRDQPRHRRSTRKPFAALALRLVLISRRSPTSSTASYNREQNSSRTRSMESYSLSSTS